MPASSLRAIDLNLLVVLEALLRTRNVTRAARELSLSQSAVSHALQRLRRLLGDSLLVRSRNEMVPTARGQSLLAPTQQLLVGIDRLISPSTGFPTGRVGQTTFRLHSTDYPQLLMLLPLAKRLAAHAPDATLELHYLTTLLPDRELDNAAVDVCIAHMPFDLPSRLRRRTLFHDRFVIIARPGHPVMSRGLTLERYGRLGHVGFFSRGTELFHTLVEKPAVHREKRISVANLGLVPELVAASNYVATISERCALLFQERYPLEIHECPFAIKSYPVEMIWHQRDDGDEARAWLRDTLTEIGAAIEARPLGPGREAGSPERRLPAAPPPAEPRRVG